MKIIENGIISTGNLQQGGTTKKARDGKTLLHDQDVDFKHNFEEEPVIFLSLIGLEANNTFSKKGENIDYLMKAVPIDENSFRFEFYGADHMEVGFLAVQWIAIDRKVTIPNKRVSFPSADVLD